MAHLRRDCSGVLRLPGRDLGRWILGRAPPHYDRLLRAWVLISEQPAFHTAWNKASTLCSGARWRCDISQKDRHNAAAVQTPSLAITSKRAD
jgi:hypothetical protein